MRHAGHMREKMSHYEEAKKRYAPGEGGRFKAMKADLAGKVRDPGAVAGVIGRKKYGKKKMAAWAARGRKGR